MLRDRIITILARQPSGMGVQTLRAELHDVSNASVGNVVSELYRGGFIERTKYGCYRVAPPKQARAAMPVATGGFLEPPSLALLMAGR